MNVWITTPTYDLLGNIQLTVEDAGGAFDIKRRVSRTATLDGGAVFSDTGYSAGDRTLDLTVVNLSKTDQESIAYLLKNYAIVHVTTPDGVFSAAPDYFNYSNGEGRLRLLIKADLING